MPAVGGRVLRPVETGRLGRSPARAGGGGGGGGSNWPCLLGRVRTRRSASCDQCGENEAERVAHELLVGDEPLLHKHELQRRPDALGLDRASWGDEVDVDYDPRLTAAEYTAA